MVTQPDQTERVFDWRGWQPLDILARSNVIDAAIASDWLREHGANEIEAARRGRRRLKMSGTQQAFAEMDERVESLRRELAEARRERDAANDVLRELASYLGAGGYNAADPINPAEFLEKIRWGIDAAERAAIVAAVARIKGTVAYRVMRPDFGRQIIEAAQQRPTDQ